VVVGAALLTAGHHGADAARAGVTHARCVEQLGRGRVDAVAVVRVGVVVTGDDEPFAGVEAAANTVVVVDVVALARRDVVGPEPDLVVVAGAVAVLLAVEARRRGVGGEEVHGAPADLDRQIPV